jgi:hypothetical protein
VDLVPERGSWIALPPTLAAQLLDAGAELPLIVQLVPLDAIGARFSQADRLSPCNGRMSHAAYGSLLQ